MAANAAQLQCVSTAANVTKLRDRVEDFLLNVIDRRSNR